MRRSLLIILVLVLSAATFDTGVAAELPGSAYIQGLVGHPQSYSLSCESRSAVDWAAYWGVYVSESEFLASLPRSDNPDAGFVGNPDHVWGSIPPYSYGVHAKPVAALLRQYGFQTKARHNMSWKDLRREIAAGRPVIVWVIGQMISGYPVEYTASNGHKTTVAHFEHTMIVVGYEPGLVHVVDAYTGLPQTYRKETFMASWGVLGHMAVTGSGEPQPEPNPVSSSTNATDVKVVLRLPVVYQRATGLQTQSTPAPTSVPEPTQPDTYTVKPGDYLAALGQRFNLDWYDLAVLNGISYPYIIYTGQVLRLR
jgi:uncharacterized protein YvpB/LysM repeat protein